MGCEASLAQRHVSVMIDPKQHSQRRVTFSYNLIGLSMLHRHWLRKVFLNVVL
jgi:hypothetical protein